MTFPISTKPVALNPCTSTSTTVHTIIVVALVTIAIIGAFALYGSASAGMPLLVSSLGLGILETAFLYFRWPRTSPKPNLEREELIQPTVRRTCCASRFVNGKLAPNPLWNTVQNVELMDLGGFRKYTPTEDEVKQVYAPSPVGPLKDALDIRWMGHASFLIRTAEFTILTDPNWSETIPFAFGEPLYYRTIKPGLEFDEVPTISHILLSHTHRDHFDPPTLNKFEKRDHPHIFCPLKADKLLKGFTHVTPLNWWDEHTLSESVTLQYVPATHASQTTALDCNEYLWGGYFLTIQLGEEKSFKIYFMGDSAWNINPSIKGFVPYYWKDNVEKFQDVFVKNGPFDVVICGIDPIDGQENMHASVTQLADLFNGLHTPPKMIIPMHWGTWPFDRWGADIIEPMRHFQTEANKYPAVRSHLKKMKVGELISFS